MRICYVILSPTFGVHLHTADLADRMVCAGHDVHLVTTACAPLNLYVAAVRAHTPVKSTGTGFGAEALQGHGWRAAAAAIYALSPDLVHFTGPHIWNVPLVHALRSHGIPVVHSLHDLEPHSGTRYGILLKAWNRLVISSADRVLVYGEVYRDRLLEMGIPAGRAVSAPLLHLFCSGASLASGQAERPSVTYEPWALFFGRLEHYKGLTNLLAACDLMNGFNQEYPNVVVAGQGDIRTFWAGPLPRRLELRSRRIDDAEAVELFSRCGLVVLPYVDATQSALIAAAYYFRKPVIVTRAGALPEYVDDGRTGLIVEPNHPASLARAMEEMLCDRNRLAEMGTAGRDWYADRRRVETRTLLDMYEELAG